MLARVAATLVAGFLLGIFYASVFPIPTVLVPGALGAALGLLVAAWMTPSHARTLLVCALCICAAVLGIIRMDAARLVPDAALATRGGEKVSIEGTVSSEPDIREGSTRLTVDVSSVSGKTVTGVRVLVIAPAYINVRYGDTIEATGELRRPELFESGEGRSFNYPMYLAVRGISYEIAFAHTRTLGSGGNPLKRAAIAIKAAYVGGLRAVLPEPYAGLAAGITAGDKRSVGGDLSDVFQQVSLVHILVLSGYNITVVLGAFMRLLTRLARVPRLIVVLTVVLFFVTISGGAANASRAGAMAFAGVYAKLYGRLFIALRVLTAIMFAMVVWNPYILAFDPGFQLSVLATLGLIVFLPHVERVITFIPERLQLREIAAATVSTQLTVLPLLLYQNGILSVVSLPANLLALVAVPAAMAFSAYAALCGIVFGTWGTILALPAYILLRYITLVAEFFASFPYASVNIPAFSPWMLVPMYACLIALYLYAERRGKIT